MIELMIALIELPSGLAIAGSRLPTLRQPFLKLVNVCSRLSISEMYLAEASYAS